MSEDLIKEIFITVALKAIEAGKELRLEKGENTSKSEVLGGAFSGNSNKNDSLSLFVYECVGNADCGEEDKDHDGSE